VEARVRRLLFEKPEEFWNLPKLQEIYKTDRRPSLREILARVFGLIPEIPTRGQLAEEAFERFVATQPTNAVHSRELRVVFVAFLLDPQCRLLLEEGKFAELRARDASLYGALARLEPEERGALIGYLQTRVPLQEFEQAA
jgi:type I restriction enzyme R subunit